MLRRLRLRARLRGRATTVGLSSHPIPPVMMHKAHKHAASPPPPTLSLPSLPAGPVVAYAGDRAAAPYLISGNEQEGGVHDSRAVKHGRHQNVVARAIDERYVSAQSER
jgi:hypothetical protein